MRQACDDGVFAVVGSGSVQDDQGAVTMVQCGLVEVAAYTATFVKGLSPRVFSPVPNPGTQYAVGPGKFIAEQFPDAVKKAGILWPNLPVGRTQAGVVNAMRSSRAPDSPSCMRTPPTCSFRTGDRSSVCSRARASTG